MADQYTLEALADPDGITGCLTRQGLSPQAAGRKADLLARCAERLKQAGAPSSARVWALLVPGRIEVLGKHTDYAGGSSIVTATEQGLVLVLRPRQDARICLLPGPPYEPAEFEISPDLRPTVGRWANYPMTAARRAARNFPGPWRGADIALDGDLPPAAGMSSSSALVVAAFLAIARLNDLPGRADYARHVGDSETLAGYLGAVESGRSFGPLAGDAGVGTFGGSEDHTAILCCRAGLLSRYCYDPVRHVRDLPMPRGWVFTVAASGITAEKTGDALGRYNRAVRLASAALEIWNHRAKRSDRNLAEALRSSPRAADRLRSFLAQAEQTEFSASDLLARLEHFLEENGQIVPTAAQALADEKLDQFGRLVDQSQELAERLLGNQVPQTVFLAREARQMGAGAASAFGAGFGGAVWALGRRDEAEGFAANWQSRYEAAFPEAASGASFLITPAGPAAFWLNDAKPEPGPPLAAR